MKKLLFLTTLLLSPVFAQNPSLTISAAQAKLRPGQSTTLTYTVTTTAPANLAGLQWTLLPPTGITNTNFTIASSGTAATKQISCANNICLVWGVNVNVVATGPVATSTVTVSPGTAAGNLSLALSNVIAGNVAGNSIPITVGPAVVIQVLSPFDLDGDGSVTITDAQLAISQIVGTTACTTADVNADMKCDLIDLLLIIRAALGL